MSDFLKKLEAKHKKPATESMTIRVTPEVDAAIKELANFYECTRQDLINDLIAEYLLPAWKQLMDNSASSEVESPLDTDAKQRYYVLNTNKVHDLDDHEYMLREHVAAAFEDGYKDKIDRFRKGDTIFLYESGRGIVAFGTADGTTHKKDHYGVADKTHFQKLDNFVRLTTPSSPKDICRVLGRNIKFVQTLTELSDGKAMLDALKG